MSEKKIERAEKPERAHYEKPKLTKWGTLRDLTRGGGGKQTEPMGGRKTRF